MYPSSTCSWLDGCPGQVRLLMDIVLLPWSEKAVIGHPATGKPCNPLPPAHGWMAAWSGPAVIGHSTSGKPCTPVPPVHG